MLLVGYYGYGNTGDAVCLQQSKRLLKQRYPHDPIYVLGARPRDVVYRWSAYRLLRALLKSKRLVFGGGGVLQNTTSWQSLGYYLLLIVCAFLCRRPVYFLGQGIGPIRGKGWRVITRGVLCLVAKASVRSLSTARLVPDCLPLIYSTDLAFYKPPVVHRSAKQSNRIALNIRSTVAFSRVIESWVNELVSTHAVTGLSLSLQDDYNQLTPLLKNAALIQLEPSYFYHKSTVAFGAVVAMRYHACVWAILQGIPFLALAYDPKVAQLAAEVKQPVVVLDQTSPVALSQCWQSFYTALPRYEQALLASRERILTLSRRHEEVWE